VSFATTEELLALLQYANTILRIAILRQEEN